MMKELTVQLGERSYPIYIGEGIIEQITAIFTKHKISRKSPLMVVTDAQVAPHYLERIIGLLQQGGFEVVSAIVPSGEQSKSLMVLEQLITDALKAGLDRSSTIVALGGGVVGDLAGYAAASYMRGIRFIQVPTTILAHDSSVGGKVAVNHKLAKNIIGAFHQPELVLYDTSTLRTLPVREIRAGLAEVLKHGLIWDSAFAEWFGENTEKLLALDPDALQYALYEGCRVKSLVVSEDEREQGLRAILNLGHTIGHALEAVAGYNELLHGEAISIGMVGAAKLSVRLGYSPEILTQTKLWLQKLDLPIQLPGHLSTEAIMQALMHDKKFSEGLMVFVVMTRIGAVEIRKDIQADWIREIIEELKREV
jgi:3-dehydroquinate synthase